MSVELVAAVLKLVRTVRNSAIIEGGSRQRSRPGYWPAEAEEATAEVRLGDLLDPSPGAPPFLVWFAATRKWRDVADDRRVVRDKLAGAPPGSKLLSIHFHELLDSKVCDWGVSGPACERVASLDGRAHARAFPVVVTSYADTSGQRGVGQASEGWRGKHRMWGIELLVMAAMIAFNGVLAAFEIALASVGLARLHVLAGEGQAGARAAAYMKENVEGSLAGVQLGITLVGAIAVATGGAGAEGQLAPPSEPGSGCRRGWPRFWPSPQSYSRSRS